MRRKLDPEKTRERILKEALTLFADKGYDGTSLGDIAKAAEVPKSLVSYHFGSKEELWQSVASSVAFPIIETLTEGVRAGHVQPIDVLKARFRRFEELPELPQVLAWAARQEIPVPDVLKTIRSELNKLARESSDPLFLIGIAAMDGFLQNRGAYSRIMGFELEGPETLATFKQSLFKLLESAYRQEAWVGELRTRVAELQTEKH